MLLWECKEIMANMTSITSYKNCHLMIFTFPDILLLVKHLVKDALTKINAIAYCPFFLYLLSCYNISTIV